MSREQSLENNIVETTVTQVSAGSLCEARVEMVVERDVTLRLNGAEFPLARCLGTSLVELAIGRLITSGAIHEPSQITLAELDREAGNVIVGAAVSRDWGPEQEASLHGIAPMSVETTRDADDLMRIGNEFNARKGLYTTTKCIHSAALHDGEETLFFEEDSGRHNAVDKVIGAAFMAGVKSEGLILLCSGRLPADMVTKAVRARTPLVISPAASTVQGVELAQKYGITLCGRVRQGGMIVYSCPQRVVI